jgi:hypothetical protein
MDIKKEEIRARKSKKKKKKMNSINYVQIFKGIESSDLQLL